MREEGQLLAGEAFVVPADARELTQKLERATAGPRDVHWRVGDVIVTAVSELDRSDQLAEARTHESADQSIEHSSVVGHALGG